jgi:hypothetical protein
VGTLRYGAVAAAAAWVVVNAGYLLTAIPAMHRRLLRGEHVRWYLEDVSAPLLAALAVVTVARAIAPEEPSAVAGPLFVAAVYVVATLAAGAATPAVRLWMLSQVLGRRSARARA